MTNLRSLSDLFKAAMKLAAAAIISALICFVNPPAAFAQQWTTTGNDISNANSGNVGVGTSTPIYKFDVLSTTNILGRFSSTAAANNQLLINAPSGFNTNLTLQQAGLSKWYLGNRASNDRFSFINAGASVEVFSILQNGNVGIGTVAPTNARLHLFSGASGATEYTAGGAPELTLESGQNTDLHFLSPNAGSARIFFGSPASNVVGAIYYMHNATVANGYMTFTANGERMRIQGNGNIGIGTTTPAYKLDVAGVINSSTGGFRFPDGTVQTTAASGAGSSQWTTSGSSIYYSGGNVGIGTTTPQRTLDLGTSGQLTFGNNGYNSTASPGFFWYTDNVNYGIYKSAGSWTAPNYQQLTLNFPTGIVIDGGSAYGKSGTVLQPNGGKVGIGTTIPLKQLNIERTGTTSADYQLMLTAPLDHTVGNWTGINFGLDGYSGGYAKGGIIYEARDGYNRGRLHFALEENANTTGATLTNSKMTVDYSGNIGIGTTAPAYKLDVAGVINSSAGGFRFPDGTVQTTAATGGGGGSVTSVFGRTGAVVAAPGDYTWAQINKTTSSLADLTTRSAGDLTSGTVAPARLGSGTANTTTFLRGDNTWTALTSSQWTTSGSNINYATAGNVGIGNASPTSKLDVTGNGHFTGNLTVDGTINAKYQDVAEWVPSSEELSAGTVVVLDQTKSNQVISSTASYDTRVAGVISEQPGITLGEGGAGKVLVATTGRVRVKVDATRAPIQIGDLLVTSDVSGVAMKSEPIEIGGRKMHMPGTLIGKALEPLAQGKGEILVLLSLQ